MSNPSADCIGPIEAASILGVARATIQRWIDAGKIKAFRTGGGHRRILRAELERFARENRFPNVRKEEPRSVLLVDDDSYTIELLREIIAISAPDVAVHAARNGFEAGVLFDQHRPALIFLDLMMPGMDGDEVCRTIRALPGGELPTIVGVSSSDDDGRLRAFHDAGLDFLFRKPFDPGEVERYVWSILGPGSIQEEVGA